MIGKHMGTATVQIGDGEYIGIFNVRVLADIEERTGKASGRAIQEMIRVGKTSDLAWLLSRMLKAGYEYTKRTGGDAAEPPTYDEILDNLGMHDSGQISDAITAIINADDQKVEAVPTKK